MRLSRASLPRESRGRKTPRTCCRSHLSYNRSNFENIPTHRPSLQRVPATDPGAAAGPAGRELPRAGDRAPHGSSGRIVAPGPHGSRAGGTSPEGAPRQPGPLPGEPRLRDIPRAGRDLPQDARPGRHPSRGARASRSSHRRGVRVRVGREGRRRSGKRYRCPDRRRAVVRAGRAGIGADTRAPGTCHQSGRDDSKRLPGKSGCSGSLRDADSERAQDPPHRHRR